MLLATLLARRFDRHQRGEVIHRRRQKTRMLARYWCQARAVLVPAAAALPCTDNLLVGARLSLVRRLPSGPVERR